MGQEINIKVTEVNLLNDRNTIQVEVLLDSIWVNVKQFPYVYVKAELSIPITEGANAVQLVYAMQQEVAVSSISEQTKSIVLNGEFPGTVDTTKEVKGTSTVYGYNKLT